VEFLNKSVRGGSFQGNGGGLVHLQNKIFDPESPYEIFVRDLVAKDGNDQVLND
jgi:hypothetical protein